MKLYFIYNNNQISFKLESKVNVLLFDEICMTQYKPQNE